LRLPPAGSTCGATCSGYSAIVQQMVDWLRGAPRSVAKGFADPEKSLG
jgi:hypothetical protein